MAQGYIGGGYKDNGLSNSYGLAYRDSVNNTKDSYDIQINWESVSDYESNSSQLTFTFTQHYPEEGEITLIGKPVIIIRLDNSYYTFDAYLDEATGYGDWGTFPVSQDGGKTKSDSFTITIPHNTDGTKSLTANVELRFANTFEYIRGYVEQWDGPDYSYDTEEDDFIYDPETIKLDTIYRQATLLTATNFTDEENPVITYSNEAGNVATLLQACISFTGGDDDIAYRDISKTGSSYTFVLTEDERNILRKAAINAPTIQVRFYLKCTVGGVTYWDYLTRNFTVTNCNPVLSNPVVKNVSDDVSNLTGSEDTLIRYVSMIEYSYEVSTSKFAEIAEQYIQCGSKKVTGLSQGVIDDVESGTFVFSVTDTRGLNTTRVIEKPIVNYIKPTCHQALKAEVDGETGAKIHLTISGNYFNGTFGAVRNTLRVEVRFTNNDGVMSEWTQLMVDPTLNGDTYTVDVTFNGFEYTKAYTFQCRVIDKLYTVQSSQYTVRAMPIFDWSEEDFNFNVPVNINGETVLRHNKEAKNTVLSASGGHIYLRPGGTDDTSAEVVINPDGTITANGETLGGAPDYIVEIGEEAMGSNGTWYWTKWNSGKAECYGKRNFGNMAITTAWGGLYRSEALTQTLPSGLFASIPEVISIDLINSNYGGWIVRHESTAPTASNTGSFIVVRPASATITPSNIGINVIGRWK